MKKRYLILAGILAASMLAAGCGKKNSVAPEQKVEATATPTVTEAAKTDVVEMQTSTDETANIKNVMGTKSETTTSIVFTNKMNSTISAIYVRPTRDDGDDSDETWGSDLVNGKFTLASNDKAVYYMEKSQKDDNGDTATSFDVRITFSDEEQNECFFRQLPLLTISQLSLCMDGEGEDGIPYATYLASGNTKEVSTLKDVKARLGIEDDSESDSDSTDSSDSTAVTPTPESSDDNGDSTDSSSSDSGSSSQGKYLGNFMLTGYCNCAQCCGTAGNATASGAMPTAGHTVAMAGVPFGTQLLINGNVYTVEDLGTPYGHVDIYCGSHSEALSFGLQYADVYQLN